jgi:hypothetical protein
MLLVFGILLTGCNINLNLNQKDELVLGSSHAWVRDDIKVSVFDQGFAVGYVSYGFVFKADGTVDSVQEDANGDWKKVLTNKYLVDGDHVTIGTKVYDFNVYDDTLYLDGTTFEKDHIGTYE